MVFGRCLGPEGGQGGEGVADQPVKGGILGRVVPGDGRLAGRVRVLTL